MLSRGAGQVNDGLWPVAASAADELHFEQKPLGDPDGTECTQWDLDPSFEFKKRRKTIVGSATMKVRELEIDGEELDWTELDEFEKDGEEFALAGNAAIPDLR